MQNGTRRARSGNGGKVMAPSSYSRFGLFNTEARIVCSTNVGEEYQIGVWLPFSYRSSNQNYPVLYVTDGDYAFGVATGLVPSLIGEKEIPEMIVVGIGYNNITSYGEFGKLRERDLLPRGCKSAPPDSRTPQFIAFLTKELFPLIETDYRASSDDRALYGFSSGGVFALYTMLTQPGLFRRYIAASCTWPDASSFLLACEERYAAQPIHPPVNLYLSVGGLEDSLPGYSALTEILRKRNYPGLHLHTQIYDGERHGSGVISQSFLYGLRAIFQPDVTT
ncbi:MAG: alpha/beta hydrolase-fold protein [Candidatus Bathyarchaeota archaeon]|nr:alpha/beta hydrolase-fold protein [Candidatus Bathyarchaeota archaeon]